VKAFIAVSLFFVLFSAVVGGALLLAMKSVQTLHLSEDLEHALMALAAVAALFTAGLLMKQLHAMIQRRL
jgi:uncharacterized membrane protein YfcA